MRQTTLDIGTDKDFVKVVNVSSVKQLSPFRYPGGKTWLVPRVVEWLHAMDEPPHTFIEPFAGGGIVSLTVANENLANNVIMVEIDDDVAAAWQVILGEDSIELIHMIKSFELTVDNSNAVLNSTSDLLVDRAFRTILRNRISHGGILAPGSGILKRGENGKGIRSRWYPETLSKRINAIESFRDKISFIHGDAFDIIEKYMEDPSCVFFVDPPYTASKKSAGRRLYTHCIVDHERLLDALSRVKGHYMITYDESKEIADMCERYGLKYRRIKMSGTHHIVRYEYVICDDFSWFDNSCQQHLQ
jgi:DNA adenine methylase